MATCRINGLRGVMAAPKPLGLLQRACVRACDLHANLLHHVCMHIIADSVLRVPCREVAPARR